MTQLNKIDSLYVKGFNPNWNDPQYIVIPNKEVKELRWWQKEAYEQLKNKQNTLIAAFCGSGKSILQVALGIHDIISSNWTQKQLIIVPQSHISRGFIGCEDLDYITVMVDGEKYEWKINHNFCDEKNLDVLKNLKKWLLTSSEKLFKNKDHIITGLNAVSSHQALGLVWNDLTKDEKKQVIDHLTLRVDEAHHIKGVFGENENGLSPEEKILMEEESTNLGKICHFIFNSNNKTSKICLTTATPYRGDRQTILSKDVLKDFDTYYLDWLDHYKTLGIKDFIMQYEEYENDPIKQVVSNIESEPKEKHMVVIPSTTHKWRPNGKDEVDELIKSISTVIPRERILDLVTPSTQSKNKVLLLQEPKILDSNKSKYDVIITCMLGREGTDWCPCSRLHNTSCENSVTLAVQTMGRPFRKFNGKTNIKIYYYVKKFIQPKKGMTKRELLSDRTNALLVCMQLDEMCHPIIIPMLPKSSKPHTDFDETDKSHTSLVEVFGNKYQQMKQELFEEIECLKVKNVENIDDIINDILDEYDIDENRENIGDALRILVLRVLSPRLRDLGIDVAFLRKEGFDKIIEKYGVKNLSIFFGSYNESDWKIIRTILKNNWDKMFEARKKVAHLL